MFLLRNWNIEDNKMSTKQNAIKKTEHVKSVEASMESVVAFQT